MHDKVFMAFVSFNQLIRRYDDYGLVHYTPSRPIYREKDAQWHRTSGSGVALCTTSRSPGVMIQLYGDEVPFHVKNGTDQRVVTTCLWCVAIAVNTIGWETDG